LRVDISFIFMYWMIAGMSILFSMRGTLCAQENLHEIMKRVLSSLSLPLRDLLNNEQPSEWRNLFSGFSRSLAFTYRLKEGLPNDTKGSGFEGEPEKKHGTKRVHQTQSFELLVYKRYILQIS